MSKKNYNSRWVVRDGKFGYLATIPMTLMNYFVQNADQLLELFEFYKTESAKVAAAYDEYKQMMEKMEIVLSFFDRVDMRGAFMPLEELEQMIEEAPDEARQHPDFQYLVGLLDGRWIHEIFGGI